MWLIFGLLLITLPPLGGSEEDPPTKSGRNSDLSFQGLTTPGLTVSPQEVTEINEALFHLRQNEKHLRERREKLFVYEIMSMVLCPVGYVLNGLSFRVFWRMCKKHKQAIMLVLMALSVADTVATMVEIDYVISANTGFSWTQNTNIGCKVIPYLTYVARDCSNVFCLLVALERFVSVYFPLKVSLWFTRKRIKIAIGCIVFVITSLEIYRLIAFKHGVQKGMHYCGRIVKYADISRKFTLALTQCLAFLVSWACICVLNFLIVLRLRKWRRQRSDLGAKNEGSDIGLTLMFLCMSVFSFSMNILAFVNVGSLLHSGKTYITNYSKLTISSIMLLANHSCNFIFYTLAGATFRENLLALITCGKRDVPGE